MSHLTWVQSCFAVSLLSSFKLSLSTVIETDDCRFTHVGWSDRWELNRTDIVWRKTHTSQHLRTVLEPYWIKQSLILKVILLYCSCFENFSWWRCWWVPFVSAAISHQHPQLQSLLSEWEDTFFQRDDLSFPCWPWHCWHQPSSLSLSIYYCIFSLKVHQQDIWLINRVCKWLSRQRERWNM